MAGTGPSGVHDVKAIRPPGRVTRSSSRPATSGWLCEHVAETRERDVERGLVKWKIRRGPLAPVDLDARNRSILTSFVKHGWDDVQARDVCSAARSGDSNVSRPTTDIEDRFVWIDGS